MADGTLLQDGAEIRFVSLGMVVLDELRFPGKEPLYDVIGGSGAYATLGARMFIEASEASSIGCIVMAGEDFPPKVEDTLADWGVNLLVKNVSDTLSTRGLLEYTDTTFGPKKFKYTAPPLKPSPGDLHATRLLMSKAFHFLATPDEIREQVPTLLRRRAQQRFVEKPLIIWEPMPASCTTDNLESHLAAYKHVDVFSPNHLELIRLFTNDVPDTIQHEALESYAERFSDDSKRCIVVRAGEHGTLFPSSQGPRWVPAHYDSVQDASRIIDPTGAGNAFLGAFTLGLQRELGIADAIVSGSIAASFALEQIGLPTRASSEKGETWNNDLVKSRLKEYIGGLEFCRYRNRAYRHHTPCSALCRSMAT